MVFEKIRKIVSDQFGINEDDIQPTTLLEDLSADSLDLVELVMAAEEEFDVEIADEDVENFTSIGDVVDYIKGMI